MEWLIGIAVVALVIFFLAKGRRDTVPTVRQHTRSAQERAKSLPEDEKDELSAEVRELALEQYDMAIAKAKEAGKDDAFAHQVGVLRAVGAVIVQGERVDPYREQELQMETVPFNKLPPDEGRRAVSEYLVYKFFPDRADERSFSPALASFKRQLSADAEKQNDPHGFMFNMIYCVKYDWQRYIAAMPASDGPTSLPTKWIGSTWHGAERKPRCQARFQASSPWDASVHYPAKPSGCYRNQHERRS